MSLSMAEGGIDRGYQPIPLFRAPGDDTVIVARLARRCCPRRSRRAVLYVHCLDDPYVPPELTDWYLDRGFHFYAADLRTGRPRGREASLAEYFGCLDAAAHQIRRTDGHRTIVVSAHRSGALIAALWCHARREDALADALVLADPEFGPDQRWLGRLLPARSDGAPQPVPGRAGPGVEIRPPELLARIQRKLRRGLDISCPVLVMSPPAPLRLPGPARWAARPARLGPHVTWLRLPGDEPGPGRRVYLSGQASTVSGRLIRKRRYEELRRWLTAYLAADVSDQLL